MNSFSILTLISSISLFAYGISCLFSFRMINEFERYGLPQFRKLVGLLEILGSIGLLIGSIYNPLLAFIASSGCSLLLLCGFIVRLKIKDSFAQSFPAIFFCLVNLHQATTFYLQLNSNSATT